MQVNLCHRLKITKIKEIVLFRVQTVDEIVLFLSTGMHSSSNSNSKNFNYPTRDNFVMVLADS